jgi:UDP-GlcNAc:undecaprenyl-phosphate/decaprenyl-phosphate GlcNAc-1-phosphate transferase
MTVLLAFGLAGCACFVLTPHIVRWANRRRLFDMPADTRRIHSEPVPRIGGVAVFAAVACTLLLVFALGGFRSESAGDPFLWLGLLAGGTVLFAVGLWDDLRGLPPLAKLVAQFAAASIVCAYGFRIDGLSVGPDLEYSLGGWALPVTILWVVGVTNAVNFIDGLDGLASGIALVALATMLSVGSVLGNPEAVLVGAALTGALLGFLRYNFSPATVFLGDSGSLFVGFMLAVLLVHGSTAGGGTVVLAVVPLFALALPLLDTLLAVGRRWLRGVPLSGADARHIHHRLLALGMSHRRATLVLYAVASVLAVLGVAIAFAPPAAVVAVSLVGGTLTLAMLVYGLRRLDYHEFAEAGHALVSGVIRFRRVIGDQISARDLARLLERAESLKQMDALLRDHAVEFGFLSIEVCRESANSRPWPGAQHAPSPRAWKVDMPVMSRRTPEDDPYVLRIWCGGSGASNRSVGVEHVARVLAPSVEAWLIDHRMVQPVAPASPPVLTMGADGMVPELPGTRGLTPALAAWGPRADAPDGGEARSINGS